MSEPEAAPTISLVAGPAYRRGVARLLLGLAGFVLIYLALLIGCVAVQLFALRWAVHEPMLLPAAIVVVLVSAPLLAFLIQALVHRRSPSGPTLTVDAAAHPGLMAVIEALAREAGIAVPGQVSLGAGVNAAMVAGVGQPELVVGLGLVNVLDVRELEAVLAHEFGHFAQSSMRLGQWAHRVTLLLRQIVLGRTRLDATLTRVRHARSLILRALAGLTAVGVRGVRGLLATLLMRLTRISQAFARELEFNADLHAVALRGSDPLVAALWRAQRGALAMNTAISQLRALAKHGIRSEDVYGHQLARLAELDDKLASQPAAQPSPMLDALRRPYRYGPELHFPPGETPAEVMWYAHPTYREREHNAKRNYVAVDEASRPSAWTLFEQPERLRAAMSRNLYAELAGASDVAPRSVDEVELALAEELAEREQGAQHHGFYDNRIVDPGPLEPLLAALEAGDVDPEQLRRDVQRWQGPELGVFMARWHELDARLERLQAIASGRIEVAAGQLEPAMDALVQAQVEREAMLAEAHRGDRAVFMHAWLHAEPAQREELVARHRFLAFVQRHISVLNHHHQAVGQLAARIDPRNYELAGHAPIELLDRFDALRRDLLALHEQARGLPVPALRNIEADATLDRLLGETAMPEPLEHDAELGPWLRVTMTHARDVHQRLRALHYKNLGQLLRISSAP